MTDINERAERVEQRLDSLTGEMRELRVDVGTLTADVATLKADVGMLKADVGTLKADVGMLKADVGTLKSDVQRLGMLYDVHTEQLRLIAEVQFHHGDLIEDIRRQLEPLRELPALMRTVTLDHEQRLRALEKAAPPDSGHLRQP